MPRNIYSFVKIEKKQTRRGIYATAAGIGAMLCLFALMTASFIKKGNLPAFAGGIGYISFLVAAAGLWVSVQLRKDTEAYGKMVHGAFYVDLAAVIVHVLIFLIGCVSIVM
ncbi:MAG: DUF6142 family protein [Coprococcus sp.]